MNKEIKKNGPKGFIELPLILYVMYIKVYYLRKKSPRPLNPGDFFLIFTFSS